MRQEFADELSKMATLVESGQLPETAIPRLFWFGHEHIGQFCSHEHDLKCVRCGLEWRVKDNPEIDPPVYADCSCPLCKTDANVYDITQGKQIGLWRCTACKHEWESEDGKTCPACGESK